LKYFVKEVNEISRSKESGTPKKKKKNELVQSSFLLSLQYKNNTLKRERGKKKKTQNKKTPLSLCVLQHHQEPYSLNSIDFHRSVSIMIFYSIEFKSI
jgi:hypothetical protein